MSSASAVKSDILCVSESGGWIYFLTIVYDTDPSRASGYIDRRPVGSDGEAESVLATNDTLRTLWGSPTGSVWATSTTGLVWTTANVPWQAAGNDELEFEAPVPSLPWRWIELPRQSRDGLRPNATSIWGSSDDHVFVGTFAGHVYHWDGTAWTQFDSGKANSIGVIRGAPDGVYFAGYGSTLLHFDGRQWRSIDDPDGEAVEDTLSGLLVDNEGIYVCGKSRGGRLLHGSQGGGFSVVGRYDVPLIGLAKWKDGLVCTAGAGGVVHITGRGIARVRPDVVVWSVSEGARHLYFTETPPAPIAATYLELDLETEAWRRMDFKGSLGII